MFNGSDSNDFQVTGSRTTLTSNQRIPKSSGMQDGTHDPSNTQTRYTLLITSRVMQDGTHDPINTQTRLYLPNHQSCNAGWHP